MIRSNMGSLDRRQIECLSGKLDMLRRSCSEWIVALDTKTYDMQKRLEELELRVRALEIHGR